jgi:hypothetical protein
MSQVGYRGNTPKYQFHELCEAIPEGISSPMSRKEVIGSISISFGLVSSEERALGIYRWLDIDEICQNTNSTSLARQFRREYLVVRVEKK